MCSSDLYSGQPLARNSLGCGVECDAQRGRGDVDANAHAARRARADRERIIDLGGGCVINAKGRDVRQRQIVHRQRNVLGGMSRAAREMFESKALEVVVIRRGDGAAALQKVRVSHV